MLLMARDVLLRKTAAPMALTTAWTAGEYVLPDGLGVPGRSDGFVATYSDGSILVGRGALRLRPRTAAPAARGRWRRALPSGRGTAGIERAARSERAAAAVVDRIGGRMGRRTRGEEEEEGAGERREVLGCDLSTTAVGEGRSTGGAGEEGKEFELLLGGAKVENAGSAGRRGDLEAERAHADGAGRAEVSPVG